MFFWNSCFFNDPADVGNLISGSSTFSKSSLYIWKFLVHIRLKSSLKDFEHYPASMWNECNCTVVWTFFDIALLWDWNESWSFPAPCPLLSFPDLLVYWVVKLPLLSQSHHSQCEYFLVAKSQKTTHVIFSIPLQEQKISPEASKVIILLQISVKMSRPRRGQCWCMLERSTMVSTQPLVKRDKEASGPR